MEHENLIAKFGRIVRELTSMNEANEVDPSNPSPRFIELVSEGRAVKNELHPLLTEIFRNRPAELAEWTKGSQAFDWLATLGQTKDLDFKTPRDDPDEETARKFAEVIAEGDATIKDLDPLVRDAVKDDPFLTAEWESIVKKHEEADRLREEEKAKESES